MEKVTNTAICDYGLQVEGNSEVSLGSEGEVASSRRLGPIFADIGKSDGQVLPVVSSNTRVRPTGSVEECRVDIYLLK